MSSTFFGVWAGLATAAAGAPKRLPRRAAFVASSVDPGHSAARATRRTARKRSSLPRPPRRHGATAAAGTALHCHAVAPGHRPAQRTRGHIFGTSPKSTWVRDGPACARSKRPRTRFWRFAHWQEIGGNRSAAHGELLQVSLADLIRTGSLYVRSKNTCRVGPPIHEQRAFRPSDHSQGPEVRSSS